MGAEANYSLLGLLVKKHIPRNFYTNSGSCMPEMTTLESTVQRIFSI